MLLAGLRGVEPHRISDLRPGQSSAASDEQQAGFQPFDLGARRRDQCECAQDVLGCQPIRAPQREVAEVHRRGRDGCWPPRTTLDLVRAEGEQVLAGVLLAAGLGMVMGMVGAARGVVLAFHAMSMNNQRNVVNKLLKGEWVNIPLRDAVRDTSGGKAGALGELLRAGLPVPDGFVVPYDVDLDIWLADDGLALALGRLGDGPVAVRSSADGEDTASTSAAGQYESVLAVRGAAEVARAVRTCWDSLGSARATAYRGGRPADRQSAGPRMAVLVQVLVDAEVSGVMFTPSRPEGVTEIEASWGLGPSIVEGRVTPDTYRVAADGTVEHTIADKPTRLDRRGTRLVTSDVPAADRTRPALEGETVAGLARLGRRVAALLGGPQDIEWVVAGGRSWVVQARPITAEPPARRAAEEVESPKPAPPHPLLTGAPASHGTATGTARIVTGPADFSRVRPGDILVCPFTDPAWTPLLQIVAGVVTEVGGVLSHAAIVARELRIPAVLSVAGATAQIPDGCLVTIDGSAGTVTLTEP